MTITEEMFQENRALIDIFPYGRDVLISIEELIGPAVEDMKIYDLGIGNAMARYVIVVSACSANHVSALVHKVVDFFKKEYKILINNNCVTGSDWGIVDFEEVVLHIMLPQSREYYDLDSMYNAMKINNS